MASMAAIGVLKVPPASSFDSTGKATEVVPTRTLSFSSSVTSSDEKKVSLKSTVSRRLKSVLRGRDMRNPMIVSPKAVSDSQNSQTCLDPDASSVSIIFFLLVIVSPTSIDLICFNGRVCWG